MDPAAQLELMWERPARFARILFGNLWHKVSRYGDLLVGSRLGSLDAPLPQLFIRAYQMVLVVTALCDASPGHRVGARFKLIGLLLVFAEYVLISTLAYVFAMPVGAGGTSIQGRYFIPLSPLLLLPLYNRRVRAFLQGMSRPRVPLRAIAVLGIVVFLILSAAVTCKSLVARYYVWA